MSAETRRGHLVVAAAAPYHPGGPFAGHFALGNLYGDPAFAGVLERGLIPGGRRLLDLGCGQGLLASWLLAARSHYDDGDWPAGWPPPPRIDRIEGIELMLRDVTRARAALGDMASFTAGDIRQQAFGKADAIVILDVLHYLSFAEQDAVLERVRDALRPAGTLLLRVGDAGGGWGFRWSKWVDRAAMFTRGHGRVRLHCRRLGEWTQALTSLGFAVEPVPMSAGTPFANVLLVAHL